MSLSSADYFDGRPPIWKQVKAWEWLADQRDATRELEQPALPLTPGINPVKNAHIFQMGSQRVLHDMGGHAAEMIESVCGFKGQNAWKHNKPCLPVVFYNFYPFDEGVGWYSLTTARMHAPFRNDQKQGFSITQKTTTVEYLNGIQFKAATSLNASDVWFRLPESASRRDSRLVLLRVPRMVKNKQFPDLGREYREQWFCLAARDRGDIHHLRAGRMPAVLSDYHDSSGQPRRFRDTMMLTLMKVDARLCCVTRVIEFHPTEGSVISIRKVPRMPLGSAMLTYSPIEHQAVTQTLDGKVS